MSVSGVLRPTTNHDYIGAMEEAAEKDDCGASVLDDWRNGASENTPDADAAQAAVDSLIAMARDAADGKNWNAASERDRASSREEKPLRRILC